MNDETPKVILQGAVAEAIALWSLAFPDLETADATGGTQVMLPGQRVLVTETPDDPPAPVSLLIRCDDAADLDRIAAILGQGGRAIMPVGEYPFAPRYTWLIDRFGVNWQITLATEERA